MKKIVHLIYIIPNLFLLIIFNMGFIDKFTIRDQFHVIYLGLVLQMSVFVYFKLKNNA